MFSIPAHHATGRNAPGQVVTAVTPTPRVQPGTLAEYVQQVQTCQLFHLAARRLVEQSKAAA